MGGFYGDLAALSEGLEKARIASEKARIASEWLIDPQTRDMAPSVVFYILKDGAPVGCGFFVTQTLAFTVSHNIHNNGLQPGFSGRTLGGSDFRFEIVEDLAGDDFMILCAPARTCADHFRVTAGSSCAALLGSKAVALLGCGIAMSEETRRIEGGSTLGVSLTITSTNVSHVGSSNKHFGYTASTYDGDSGACLFFTPDNCVVGIHQEGVNRAKELMEQEESLGDAAGGGGGPSGSRKRTWGGLERLSEVADSVKSIIQHMSTGGIGLFLGSAGVQVAFQSAKAREEAGELAPPT